MYVCRRQRSSKGSDWEKRILGGGNAAFVAAGIVHAAFNTLAKSDARLLVIFSPCIGDSFEAVDVSGERTRGMSSGS